MAVIKRQAGFTLIELMIVVAIIGILAAFAIPQYQNYVARAQVSEALSLASGAKTAVAEYFNMNGTFPADNKTAGLSDAADISGKYVESVTVADGVITARFSSGAHAKLDGGSMALTAVDNGGSIGWSCSSSDISDHLPSSCAEVTGTTIPLPSSASAPASLPSSASAPVDLSKAKEIAKVAIEAKAKEIAKVAIEAKKIGSEMAEAVEKAKADIEKKTKEMAEAEEKAEEKAKIEKEKKEKELAKKEKEKEELVKWKGKWIPATAKTCCGSTFFSFCTKICGGGFGKCVEPTCYK